MDKDKRRIFHYVGETVLTAVKKVYKAIGR